MSGWRMLATGVAALGLYFITASPQQVDDPTGYTPAQMRQASGFDQASSLPNSDCNNAGQGKITAFINFSSQQQRA
jgi:hypothetical protein